MHPLPEQTPPLKHGFWTQALSGVAVVAFIFKDN